MRAHQCAGTRRDELWMESSRWDPWTWSSSFEARRVWPFLVPIIWILLILMTSPDGILKSRETDVGGVDIDVLDLFFDDLFRLISIRRAVAVALDVRSASPTAAASFTCLDRPEDPGRNGHRQTRWIACGDKEAVDVFDRAAPCSRIASGLSGCVRRRRWSAGRRTSTDARMPANSQSKNRKASHLDVTDIPATC